MSETGLGRVKTEKRDGGLEFRANSPQQDQEREGYRGHDNLYGQLMIDTLLDVNMG